MLARTPAPRIEIIDTDESKPEFTQILRAIEENPPATIIQGEFTSLRINGESRYRSLATPALQTCVCVVLVTKNAARDYVIGITHFDSLVRLEESFVEFLRDFNRKKETDSKITAKIIGGRKGTFGSYTPLLFMDGNSEELVDRVKSLVERIPAVEILDHDHYSRKGPCEMPLPGTGFYMYDVIVGVRADDSISCIVNHSNESNRITSSLINIFQESDQTKEREGRYDEREEYNSEDSRRPAHAAVNFEVRAVSHSQLSLPVYRRK